LALAIFYALLLLRIPLESIERVSVNSWSPFEFTTLLNVAAALALWTLVALLIQPAFARGDGKNGSAQPSSLGGLLLSKAIFVLVFVQLPVFLAQALILERFHISPLGILPAMLTKQALFAVFLVLPAMALAAGATSLKWYFGGLTLLAIATLAASLLATGERILAFESGGYGWVRIPIVALPLAVFSIAVIAVQCRRGSTWQVLALLVLGTGLTLAATFYFPPSAAAAIDKALRPDRLNADSVQIAFVADPSRLPLELAIERSPRGNAAAGLGPQSDSPAVLAFTAAHLLPGAWIHLDSVFLGESGLASGQTNYSARPLSGREREAGPDGTATFFLLIDGAAPTRLGAGPKSLRAALAVTVSEQAELSPIPLTEGFIGLPGIGSCVLLTGNRWACLSPYHGPALVASAADAAPESVEPVWTEVFPLREAGIPISTTIGFEPLEIVPVAMTARRLRFRAQWAAATIQRTVELGAIDLRAYRHDLPTAPDR
jgi:hypothetical protein